MLPLETRINEVLANHYDERMTPKLIKILTEEIMEQINFVI